MSLGSLIRCRVALDRIEDRSVEWRAGDTGGVAGVVGFFWGLRSVRRSIIRRVLLSPLEVAEAWR